MKIEDPIDIQILTLLSQGLVEKEIGPKIKLSKGAVHKRIGKLMEKLACTKSTRLVAIAFEQGIIKIAV
jgi:DNA-binding NarL/FixJ family response regulator